MTALSTSARALADDRSDRTVRQVLFLLTVVAHMSALLLYVERSHDEVFAPPAANGTQLQTYRPAAPPPAMRPKRPQRERRELAPIPEVEIDLAEPETESQPLTPPPIAQLSLDFLGDVSGPGGQGDTVGATVPGVGSTASGAQGPFQPGVAGLILPVIIEKTKINPRYPDVARDQRVNGQVVLMCVATRRGDIADCRVVHEAPLGVGFAHEATTVVVDKWKCVPGRRNGEAVDVYMTITVTFSLGY